MPKTIQFKSKNSNVFPKIIFKSVRNINLGAGQQYSYEDILKSSLIIVYFTVSNAQYKNQFLIPRGDWQWFLNVTNGWITYVCVDWENGILKTSGGNTDNENHFIAGYDLIA